MPFHQLQNFNSRHIAYVLWVFMIACTDSSKNDEVVGVWQLNSWTAHHHDSITYPYGEEAQGQIIYTKGGKMSFMLSKNNRENFGTQDRSKITAEQALKANNSFFAYWGNYTVDFEKKIITHHIHQSLLPDWSGTNQLRYFELGQDTLLLISDTIANKVYRLSWTRLTSQGLR